MSKPVELCHQQFPRAQPHAYLWSKLYMVKSQVLSTIFWCREEFLLVESSVDQQLEVAEPEHADNLLLQKIFKTEDDNESEKLDQSIIKKMMKKREEEEVTGENHGADSLECFTAIHAPRLAGKSEKRESGHRIQVQNAFQD
ncbi:hypothetical protein SADUNF_Sadunf07G0022400 [Salix dunnii]|uniref:Uncharacterized protein n=1 Tax=Salix dunnii TaxID=1413687 RepID=A0A835JVE8_9ROSI|nr:hypothetical protein SADUNF_Sadunf07G0022400 [Salix dunnii]